LIFKGKNTFFELFEFKNKNYNLMKCGDVKINGKPLRDKSQLTSISGYIEKHDLFSGTLTVRETLIFQV
jgi:ABC-type multidrug transport system ATPase subunit